MSIAGLFILAYLILGITSDQNSVPVAQAINWLLLSSALVLSIIFVGRDTRRRGYSWPETIAWVIMSTATFPIVFGLYFLLRGKISRKLDHGMILAIFGCLIIFIAFIYASTISIIPLLIGIALLIIAFRTKGH